MGIVRSRSVNNVYMLGAGFSKQISKEMPLLTELSAMIRERGVNLPPALETLGDNLEIWLSYLSQSYPWLSESQNLRNLALALDIAEAVRVILEEKELLVVQEDCPDWLRALTESWHYEQGAVISFNYDTLIERATGMIEISPNNHVSADQLYPVRLTRSTRRDAMVFGSDDISSFNLFKLHGSINWYYSGSIESTGEVLYYTGVNPWGETSDREQREKSAVDDKVPLIVPPTSEKVRFFQHESLKRNWSRASAILKESNTLYVLGYSLPQTDLAVRLFLHESSGATTEKKRLVIVNDDSSIADRYQDLLGGAYTISDQFVGPQSIERFVDHHC